MKKIPKSRVKMLIFLVLAIIIGVGGIWGYNFYQKQAKQQADLVGQLNAKDVDKYFKNDANRPEQGSVLPPDNIKNQYLAEIKISEQAIKDNKPSKPEYKDLKDDYFNIAHAYDIMANYKEAEIAYKVVLDKWPGDYKTMINLNNLYLMMGQYKDSATLLYQVLDLYPKEEGAYFRLANLYGKYSSDYNQADAIYKLGIKNSTTKLDLTKDYAYYLERVKKDYAAAINMWREYEKISGSVEQKEIDRLQNSMNLK